MVALWGHTICCVLSSVMSPSLCRSVRLLQTFLARAIVSYSAVLVLSIGLWRCYPRRMMILCRVSSGDTSAPATRPARRAPDTGTLGRSETNQLQRLSRETPTLLLHALVRRAAAKHDLTEPARGRAAARSRRSERVEVLCVAGTTVTVDGRLPADFPIGYHQVTVGGHIRRLIVSPGRCWLPEGWRAGAGPPSCTRRVRGRAGAWATSVTCVRCGSGQRIWGGIPPRQPAARGRARAAPGDQPLPAATRRFRNPLYLRIDDVRELANSTSRTCASGRAG
jgi:hypothetical protein